MVARHANLVKPPPVLVDLANHACQHAVPLSVDHVNLRDRMRRADRSNRESFFIALVLFSRPPA
jgi:hypothetical protein